MQPVRLSYTRIRDLECGYRFWRLNMLGEQEAKAAYSIRGSQGHEIIADYIRRLVKINRPTAARLFGKVFDDHTKRLPMREINIMSPILGNFQQWFKLPQSYRRVLTEHEMAVARDGTPLRMDEALHPTGMPKVDCFTGIGDLLIETSDEEAKLSDWKLGFQMFDVFEAGNSLQGKGYAYLWFQHNPQCQRVAFTLYAPQFRLISVAEFERKRLVPEFAEHLAGRWAIVDKLREKAKKKLAEGKPERWDERVHYDAACRYCRLPGCRIKQEVTGVA